MRDTIVQSIRADLTSSTYRRVASILAYLTALGNLLDALTTGIGLSLGGHEMMTATIAIMNAYGVPGWVILKVVMGGVYAVLGIAFSRRWGRFRPLFCFLIICVLGVSFIEFGLLPVTNNLIQLARYAGLNWHGSVTRNGRFVA